MSRRMSAATDKVDVLAPHRREVDAARKSVNFGRRVTLIPGAMERRERELAAAEARLAAVAELIEKANAVSGEPGGDPCDCDEGDKHGDCGHCELRAALARVGGAS